MSTIAMHPTYRPTYRPASRQATLDVRLTRRGRIVLTMLFLGIALALLTVFVPRSIATGEHGTQVPTTTVVVGEGDTLWDIASAVADPGETREMMRRIVQLNSLTSSTIFNGQELAVPKK